MDVLRSGYLPVALWLRNWSLTACCAEEHHAAYSCWHTSIVKLTTNTVEPLISHDSSITDFNSSQLLSIQKLLRLLRVARIIKLIKGFKVILQACQTSMRTPMLETHNSHQSHVFHLSTCIWLSQHTFACCYAHSSSSTAHLHLSSCMNVVHAVTKVCKGIQAEGSSAGRAADA